MPPEPASDPDLLAPLRLVVGDEELLASRAIGTVIAAARGADPQVDVRELDARELTAADLPELVSPSLFGERRVVVVAGVQDATKDLAESLARYAADPAPEVTLVVAHSGGARNKGLVEGMTKAGAVVVRCPKVTRPAERLDFVRAELARFGAPAPPEVARALVEAVGSDLRELSAACAQLASDTGGAVDVAAVARYHRGRAGVSGFVVADKAVVGDVAGALEALRWAASLGVADVLVADALADGVRTVARVAAAGRAHPSQVASALRMPPWKVERARAQGKGWTPAGISAAMRAAAEVNAAVKGTAADPAYALQSAVLAIAAARELR